MSSSILAHQLQKTVVNHIDKTDKDKAFNDLNLSNVPNMDMDFMGLRSSLDQRHRYLVVKKAALNPDEIIEQEAEVSKGIKKLYD